MSATEKRATLALAGIYMLRMLGLFLILPVFSLYARQLPDATPHLIGLAIGIYGLTQALLQIPFGVLSDRYGRHVLIRIGLLIFAGGSFMASMADSIYGIIAGRALQGAGAIAGVVMALVADLTREEHRTKAMALIGVSIGMSFAVSMVAGPVFAGWLGVPGLFWMIGALALLAIIVLQTLVPTPAVSRFHRDAQANPAQFRSVVGNVELLRLNGGVFVLHMVLTAMFVVMPLVLRDTLGMETARHWQVYLPVFVGSLLSMVPCIVLAGKGSFFKGIFLFGILCVTAACAGLALGSSTLWSAAGFLYVFFTGFNLLEAMLPSLVARIAPPDLKGTAMGMFSTAQFLGAFAGGMLGGWVQGLAGIEAVFLVCAGAALLWLLMAFFMRPPKMLRSRLLRLGELTPETASRAAGRLRQVVGVAEAVVLADDGVAYLKVDPRLLDELALWETVRELVPSDA
ncbi:MAG TPA: MFS transporter [Methylococcaceae bacterium]|nr:MFS transporter [Methylococcaceae bacterium]